MVLIIFSESGCATNQRSRQVADVHLKSAIVNIELGQFTAALRELFEAKKLNPNDPEIHFYLGVAYWGRGLKNESFEAFSQAVELRPDYSEAYNYMGLICFEAGRYDEAIAYFKRALNNVLYDTPEFALFNMGRAYRQKGEDLQALESFEKALQIRPNRILPLIHNNMGTLLLSLGRTDEAILHLREATKYAPHVADFHYSLGAALLKEGRSTEAIDEFRKVIELAPESGFAERAREMLATLPEQ